MRLVTRTASVRWTAGVRGGARTAATGSGVLGRIPFLSAIPSGGNSNSNPAELLAAAHAASFSRALARELGPTALSAGDMVTSSSVTLERLGAGWSISNIHLSVAARLPKVTQGRFIDAAVRAKTNCLVSQALRATISINARLES